MQFKKRLSFFGIAIISCLICNLFLILHNNYYYNGGDTFLSEDNVIKDKGPNPTFLGSGQLNPNLNATHPVHGVTHTIQITNTSCPHVLIPNEADAETRWRNVTYDKNNYVYSAYIDGDNVRIIGASTKGTHSLHCQLWFKQKDDDNVTMATKKAIISQIPEGRGLKYSATYYMCPLSNLGLPYAVSLVGQDACQIPRHVLHIPIHNGEKIKFSVCVKPFVYNYSRAYELVEWLELHLMLGVGHFTFFNHSSMGNIKQVLDSYSKRGLVEVLQWNLPMQISTWPPSKTIELHAFGHLVSSNDCIYRHVANTEYLSIVDVDEFIVPRDTRDYTWDDMFRRLPAASQYIFRNCFFRKEWNDSPDDTNSTVKGFIDKYRLVTPSKLQREEEIWKNGQRSKLIVKPIDIVTMGIHNVWKMKHGNAHVVDPDIGMLHHYRDWEIENDRKIRVLDDTMLKFKDDIIRRVGNTWDQLPGVELDIPNHN